MKISKEIKERIAKKAAQKYIEKTKIKLKLNEERLAVKCWRHVYSKKELDAIKNVPDGWLRKCTCFRFNVNGWQITLNAKEALPTKFQEYSCKVIGNIEAGELATEVQEHSQAISKSNDEYSAFYHKVLSMMLGISTYDKLKKLWPEGEAFYKEFLPKEGVAASVPAILVSDINASLGLKSGGK